jgi:hypothetical protein
VASESADALSRVAAENLDVRVLLKNAAGEWLKGSHSSGGVVTECVQLSALLLAVLPLCVRRMPLPLHHVLADVALVIPLGWLFWRL